MAKMMGFGGMMNGGSAGMPAAIKQDYLTDPRAAMAMQLMKEGSSTAPVQSPLEGLARALTAGLGGYQAGKVRDEYQGQAADYASALQNAYSGASSYSDVAGKLSASNNPYLQEQAAALFGKDMESRQKRSDEMFGKGLNYDPSTGQVAPIAGYGGALGGVKADEMRATNPVEAEGAALKAAATYPFDIRKAAASASRTNVMNVQEKEFDKKVGGEFGQQYADLMKAGMAAPGKVAKLDRLNQLLDGVSTGTFKGTTTELKAAAKGAGIDLESMGIKDDVGPVQAAQALSQAMALELRNPAGGAGMPGAMSDSDRKFLEKMTPGIETTPQGRALMVETQKRLAKRDQDVSKLAADYRTKNGRFDEGFYNELAQYSASKPLFDDLSSTASPAAPGAAPAAAPAVNYKSKYGLK